MDCGSLAYHNLSSLYQYLLWYQVGWTDPETGSQDDAQVSLTVGTEGRQKPNQNIISYLLYIRTRSEGYECTAMFS